MRKLNVGGEVVQFMVGRSFTRVVDARGSFCIENHLIVGVTPDDFARGQWKKTQDGMVTPGRLRKYLEAFHGR